MMRPALALASLAALVLPNSGTAAVPPQVEVELVASTLTPRPGSVAMVGFRMEPKLGWHGYWSNAGGGGIAPNVTWSAPDGVRFGPLRHPAPTLFESMGVVSYVHSGAHVLISRMTVPATMKAGTPIPIKADLQWAVCSDTLCVPGNATFSILLVAGSGSASPQARLFERASARVPKVVSGGRYWVDGANLSLALPDGVRLSAEETHFFPDENGFFDPMTARTAAGSPAVISGRLTGPPPARVTGVVSDGKASYRLALVRHAPPAAAEPAPTAAVEPAQQEIRKPDPQPLAKRPVEPSPAGQGRSLPWPLGLAAAAIIAACLALIARRRRKQA